MPSLLGTTAVVTGGNSGIGYHTALELARHGATVTLAVRTPEKGEAAAVRIRESAAEARVQVARLDLGSLDSVREFAEAAVGAGDDYGPSGERRQIGCGPLTHADHPSAAIGEGRPAL